MGLFTKTNWRRGLGQWQRAACAKNWAGPPCGGPAFLVGINQPGQELLLGLLGGLLLRGGLGCLLCFLCHVRGSLQLSRAPGLHFATHTLRCPPGQVAPRYERVFVGACAPHVPRSQQTVTVKHCVRPPSATLADYGDSRIETNRRVIRQDECASRGKIFFAERFRRAAKSRITNHD